jgi:hypothetical protein
MAGPPLLLTLPADAVRLAMPIAAALSSRMGKPGMPRAGVAGRKIAPRSLSILSFDIVT